MTRHEAKDHSDSHNESLSQPMGYNKYNYHRLCSLCFDADIVCLYVIFWLEESRCHLDPCRCYFKHGPWFLFGTFKKTWLSYVIEFLFDQFKVLIELTWNSWFFRQFGLSWMQVLT